MRARVRFSALADTWALASGSARGGDGLFADELPVDLEHCRITNEFRHGMLLVRVERGADA